jgi:hypothetical protein
MHYDQYVHSRYEIPECVSVGCKVSDRQGVYYTALKVTIINEINTV